MTGKYFEDLNVGEVYHHPKPSEDPIVVTSQDNDTFNKLTRNNQLIHFEDEEAKERGFEGAIANSLYTLSIVVGATVNELTNGTIIANLSYDNVEHPRPVYMGDKISVKTEILSKRPSRSKPDRGIVKLKHTGFNQAGEIVVIIDRTVLFQKRHLIPEVDKQPV